MNQSPAQASPANAAVLPVAEPNKAPLPGASPLTEAEKKAAADKAAAEAKANS